jgi:hypothetical protein
MPDVRIMHGAYVHIPSPDEIAVAVNRGPDRLRHRIPASLALDGTGSGKVNIWDIPAGMKFEVRRIMLSLTGNVPSDPNTGNVLLNAAGKFVALLRSDSLIEYLQPTYGAAIQVPGIQTWSREQGPYIANKEVLQLQAAGLTGNLELGIYVEGILEVPPDAAS